MRILYLSYFYPPLGGPASLRNVKTVKYLARAGIASTVVTVRDLEYLVRDASLLAEQAEEKLIRTASWDPMALARKVGASKGKESSRLYLDTPEKLKLWVRRLYPIDSKIGWNPFLVRAGRQALKEQKHDLIYVSLGPFSSVVGAYRLSREFRLPLVLDLRDYWTLLSDYKLQGTALHRAFSRHWEQKAYRHASLIVTATEGIGTDAAAAFGADLAPKLLTVCNGWDESDFQDLPQAPREEGFSLAYFGNIYARRSLKHLYQALKRLREENALPAGTRVRLYGNFFKEALDEIAASGIGDIVETVPQIEHRAALARMLASDALILVVNSSAPSGTLTSKVFEYLRAQKPVLALVPERGEAARLLRSCGQDLICPMESADAIYLCLKRLFADSTKDYSVPWELEREQQSARLADRLHSLIPPAS